MDAGGLAQMSSNTFPPQNGLTMPGNFATRRGSQNIKPLSFETIKQNSHAKEGGVPTPRTSRSHLLAGLRTAPKSANSASFSGPATSNPTMSAQHHSRKSMAANYQGYGQDNLLRNTPQTALPQYGPQQSAYQSLMGQKQYTVDQVLAPPEITMDEKVQEHMDPNLYAQLVATNAYLAQQQQRLQQQLRSVQATAQQFQQLNLNHPQLTQQKMAIFEQQQQLRNLQQQLGVQAAMGQGQQVYYSALTGQYYVDLSTHTVPATPAYSDQPMSPGFNSVQHQKQQYGTLRVQVSPPLENHQSTTFRNLSPPRPYDSSSTVTPLPPPSVNAFRRGHKKTSSLAPSHSGSTVAGNLSAEVPKSAGPKTASFPLTSITGSYGPGQGRAGEHPIRQPRCPPSLDELKAKPTARQEGSKNFASRTRRSAVNNLVKAGMERRKGAGSGNMSPSSETPEDLSITLTDNDSDSDSGGSGSGILAGEMEYGSSRTSASGSWGAIGSDRPSSRQKARTSVDSTNSNGETVSDSSFAAVFKNGALRASKAHEAVDSPRKASRLVLTSMEKRKAAPAP